MSKIIGKSSLTVQFVDGHFVDSYYPTIENTFSKIIKHKGQDYATEIIDTAGQVCDRPCTNNDTVTIDSTMAVRKGLLREHLGLRLSRSTLTSSVSCRTSTAS